MIDDHRVFSLTKGVALQVLGADEGAVVLTVESGQLFTCNDTTAKFLQFASFPNGEPPFPLQHQIANVPGSKRSYSFLTTA